MGWRIVYIENASSIKLYLDNLHIRRDNDELTIPLSDIHTLILDSYQTTISVPLLIKCCEYNINLVLCNIEHLPCGTLNTLNGNYISAKILNKQIGWNDDLKKIVHKLIIKNKIENQCDLLKKLNKNEDVISILVEYTYQIQDGDITNREGLAAKMYFRELFGKGFIRFNDDVINAGLNYGYSILRSQISKTIIGKGLNPSLGIFHKGQSNFYNLSDDIIEVFRPLIDNYVYNNLLDSIILKKENRMELIKLTGNDVLIDNMKQSLFNSIKIFIEAIIDIFETGNLDLYKPIRLDYEL